MLFSFLFSIGMIYTVELCLGIRFIDIDIDKDTNIVRKDKNNYNKVSSKSTTEGRRYWLVSSDLNLNSEKNAEEDEKDDRLKSKITTLVEQTLHDTDTKISSIQHLKDQHREESPYRAGFILSMIKKSKDVLNELFNVAVKHRDDWKALEQLKIFELIVHTNVDTTNLVRQLVEIHIQHMNTTNSAESKKRVVLLK